MLNDFYCLKLILHMGQNWPDDMLNSWSVIPKNFTVFHINFNLNNKMFILNQSLIIGNILIKLFE